MKTAFHVLSGLRVFDGAVTFGGNDTASSANPGVRPADSPAYLLAVGTRLKPPEALAAYRRAAGPLAVAAGLQATRNSTIKSHGQCARRTLAL